MFFQRTAKTIPILLRKKKKFRLLLCFYKDFLSELHKKLTSSDHRLMYQDRTVDGHCDFYRTETRKNILLILIKLIH